MVSNPDAVQRLMQDSGSAEYYTPAELVEAARWTMGGIDLDPASCAEAQRTVRATRYYTIADDGLALPWSGRVWLNHPFSKGWRACAPSCRRQTCARRGYHVLVDVPSNADWIDRLVRGFNDGCIKQAVAICFASTAERWYAPLHHYPQVYLSPRTNYRDREGRIVKGVTKGSVVTYLGPNPARFFQAFHRYGFPHAPAVPTRGDADAWRSIV